MALRCCSADEIQVASACNQHSEDTCMQMVSWQGVHAAERCATMQGV